MKGEEAKKVYCSNCRKFDSWEGECGATYTKDNYYKQTAYYYDARVKNKNNDCDEYEQIEQVQLFKKFHEWMDKKIGAWL